MDCLLPPLTTIQHGTWKCPLCIPRHLLSQTATRHLGLLPLFSTLIKISEKKDDSPSPIRVSRLPITIYQPKKKVFSQTRPPEFRPHTHVHAYHEGSGFQNPSLVPWFAMEGTWDLDPDNFLLLVFFLYFF